MRALQKDAQVTQDFQITLSGRDLRGGLCLLQTKQDKWTPGQSLTDCLVLVRARILGC